MTAAARGTGPGLGGARGLIITITHDHADRVRSFALLAQEWERP